MTENLSVMHRALKNASKLPDGVSILRDKTPIQREVYSKLVLEVKEYNKNHPII